MSKWMSEITNLTVKRKNQVYKGHDLTLYAIRILMQRNTNKYFWILLIEQGQIVHFSSSLMVISCVFEPNLPVSSCSPTWAVWTGVSFLCPLSASAQTDVRLLTISRNIFTLYTAVSRLSFTFPSAMLSNCKVSISPHTSRHYTVQITHILLCKCSETGIHW